MKPENNVTLQDWLDIVWQSAVQARDKGLNLQFVDLGGSVGVRIFDVVLRENRPYLVGADEVEAVVEAAEPVEVTIS